MSALKKLREGGFAVGTMVMMDSMLSAEVAARAGFDFLCLDRQHGMIDDALLWRQIAAIAKVGGADPWVRVPWNTPADAMRALDGGAAAIIAPMVDTRDQADALVRACRYPPQGMRSWGPVRAGLDDAFAYTAAANDSLAVIAMIETKPGYENLAEIAATPHLDALFVGPNDLSLALGNWQPGMPDDPAFIDVLKEIVAAAKANGKLSGIHCADAAMARKAEEWGFSFVTIAADIAFLGQAAKAVATAAKG